MRPSTSRPASLTQLGQLTARAEIEQLKAELHDDNDLSDIPDADVWLTEADYHKAMLPEDSLSTKTDTSEKEPLVLDCAKKMKASEWPRPAVEAFIRLCQEEEISASSSGIGIFTKSFWAKVSKKMKEEGHYYTDDQCKSKMQNLKNQYKNQKEKASKTGASKVTWEYYELMSKFMDDRPEIVPVFVADSAGTYQEKEDGASASDSSSDTSVRKKIELGKKRKTGSDIEFVAALNRFTDSAEKRHAERMEKKDRMISLLEAYLNK